MQTIAVMAAGKSRFSVQHCSWPLRFLASGDTGCAGLACSPPGIREYGRMSGRSETDGDAVKVRVFFQYFEGYHRFRHIGKRQIVPSWQALVTPGATNGDATSCAFVSREPRDH